MTPLRFALDWLLNTHTHPNMSPGQAQASPQPRENQYSPLPTEKSIRLINFLSGNVSQGGEIRINLSIHSLESLPAYQCLSYTWGNPTSPYSEDAEMSEIVYESTGEVGVDNSMLSVKYNLHDALEVLRSRVESTSPSTSGLTPFV
jgi:hypothetical protein